MLKRRLSFRKLAVVTIIAISGHVEAYQYFTVGNASKYDDRVYPMDKVSNDTANDQEQYVPLWDQKKIVFHVPDVLPSTLASQISIDEFKNVIEGVKQFWNSKNSGVELDFDFGEKLETFHIDGKNIFSFVKKNEYKDLPEGYTGIALAYVKKSKDIFKLDSCDLLISYEDFPSFKNSTLKNIQYEISEVVTHEIGHCFGLAHSWIPNSVMFYSDNERGEKWDTNLIEDRLSMQNLYPPTVSSERLSTGTIRGDVQDASSKQASTNKQILFIDQNGKLIFDVVSGMVEQEKGAIGRAYDANSGKFIVQYVPTGTYYAVIQDAYHVRDLDIDTPRPGSAIESTDRIHRVGLWNIRVQPNANVDLGNIFVEARQEEQTDLIDEDLFNTKTKRWMEMGMVKYDFPLKCRQTYKVRFKPREKIEIDPSSLRFLSDALIVSNGVKTKNGMIEYDVRVGPNTDPNSYKFLFAKDITGKKWLFNSRLNLLNQQNSDRVRRLPPPLK